MNAADILSAFRTGGLVLIAEGDRIRVEPVGRLTEEARNLIRANKPALLELLRAANDPATAHRRWLTHYADREPVERHFRPDATTAEVLAWHPDAIAAEPLPDSDRVAQPLSPELDGLIRTVAAFHGFTSDELEEALAVASRDVDNALVSFRLLAAGVDAFMDIDREAFAERAGILEYDGLYSRPEAELLAAWEATQALFARLTAREWLARYAPERLADGEAPENYPVAQIPPGNTFWMERARRGGRR